MSAAPFEPVRKLRPGDGIDTFDCGQPALNQFLRRHALVNQKANRAQTYVCCCANQVAGYYSLTVGSVTPESAPDHERPGPISGAGDDPGQAGR